MEEEIVLCAANSYEQKYYLNPEFEMLPESIKQELNIMCVLYTENVGGILMVFYDEDGNLEFRVDHEENDFSFDEIGSVLKIKQLQQTKEKLEELENRDGEMWRKVAGYILTAVLGIVIGFLVKQDGIY